MGIVISIYIYIYRLRRSLWPGYLRCACVKRTHARVHAYFGLTRSRHHVSLFNLLLPTNSSFMSLSGDSVLAHLPFISAFHLFIHVALHISVFDFEKFYVSQF